MSAIEKFKNREPAVTIQGATQNVPQARLSIFRTPLSIAVVEGFWKPNLEIIT